MLRSSYIPKIFHFAGLDFILDRRGNWVLLEINDHPIGLIEADKLTQQAKGRPIFGGTGLIALANMLANHAGDRAVCLLLPDCFRIRTKTHTAQTVFMNGGDIYDDKRIRLTLDSFNRLADQVRSMGVECLISDVGGLEIRNRSVIVGQHRAVGALFRRASSFPPKEVDCACINDLRLRTLCADKLKAHGILKNSVSHNNLALTMPLLPVKDTLELLQNCQEDQFVITKPNWGSASMGVERLTARQLTEYLYSTRRDAAENRIWQKWIEPTTISNAKGEYYFDVRVYVVAGKPVAGFARRSAAPMNRDESDTPLSWLTTTGPWLPLIYSDTRALESVDLSEEQIKELVEISTQATLALDKAAIETDYSKALAGMPSFSTLAGVQGRLQLIYLQDHKE